MQSAVVEMRLSAKGSSCTSSCMAIINTSSECKGKCVLTVWDNQCLSERCIVEALWDILHMQSMYQNDSPCVGYEPFDSSMHMILASQYRCIINHIYFSRTRFEFKYNEKKNKHSLKQCWGRTLMLLLFWFFLTDISDTVSNTSHICIYCHIEREILSPCPSGKQSAIKRVLYNLVFKTCTSG